LLKLRKWKRNTVRKKERDEGLKGIKYRKKGGEGRKYETIPVAFSRVF
jgi:hypothetical protein